MRLGAIYRIRFYKDGKVLKTSPVEQLGFTVLGLSVGNVDRQQCGRYCRGRAAYGGL